METRQQFELTDVNIESLFIEWTSNSAVRPMYPPKRPPFPVYFLEDPLKVIGELSFNDLNQDSFQPVGTPIQEFFRGLNVLVTGGSGFMGKVLTEKLVRSIPHLSHIYLLIRPKKGRNCEERFEQLLKDKVFSRMKAEVPSYRTMITAISGDVSEDDLGLSAEDRQLLISKVNVVFHCAANVRFLEPLRKVVTSNVLGSRNVMHLAKKLKDLKAYVHVSTAFSQCVYRVIKEEVPTMSVKYKDILQYVSSNTDAHIEENIHKILQGWPNTYAFSKALCESMILEEFRDLPICIFRPSIVMSTCQEPVRGWTDNMYGPVAALVGVSLGILHCIRVDENNVVDIVPVDYVVNSMIAAAWSTCNQRKSDVLCIYNFTSSPQNTFYWRQFWAGLECVDFFPANNMIWCPSATTTKNYYLNKVCHLALHTIPGMILDKLAVLSGKRPRLGKIYKSIDALDETTLYFKNGTWEFKNENVKQLWTSLSEDDKRLYNFDVRDINWVEYIHTSWIGGRYYLLNEGMDTIPGALRKMKWFKVAHKGLKVFSWFVLLKLAVFTARAIPIL